METKRCFKCGQIKPSVEYYLHPRMMDGRLNKCKDCAKRDARARRTVMLQNPEWVEMEKERCRLKGLKDYIKIKGSPKIKDIRKRANIRWQQKYPEKRIASSVANKSCPTVKGFHNHHWSYNKIHYKDVIVLRVKDHYYIHRYITYDSSIKMYRNKAGAILDSKEKHMDYIKSILNQNVM